MYRGVDVVEWHTQLLHAPFVVVIVVVNRVEHFVPEPSL
jgi:hypothetical protein